MHLVYRFTRFVVWCVLRLLYRHQTVGIDHLPHAGALLAANHSSYLDPPLVAISSPLQVHFLARRSLFRWGPFSWLIRLLNAHAIHGSAQDISAFKTVQALIKSGQQVLLFPEGLRSKDGALQPLRSGVALLALRCKCPIVPIYIHGSFEAWPRQRPFPRLFGRPKLRTACIFGQPIAVEPYLHGDKKACQEALTQAVAAAIATLRHEWTSAHLLDNEEHN